MAGGVVTLEQAKSGRSTCRASGEPIAKGDWRVGFETWISGRVAMAWMKPLPFLEGCCRVEYALSAGGSQGACKATGHKFVRGEPRFVLTAGDPQKKGYLSLPAAGAELAPVVQQVGREAWAPTRCAGLADLAEQDRRAFYKAFGVSQAEADSFDQQHPAPERPSTAKPSPAKAAAGGGGGGGSRGRPAKRAKVAQTSESSSDSEEDAEAEEGAEGAEEGGEQQQQQQQQQQQEEQEEQRGKPAREQKADVQQGGGGLTEMERQRLELIKRNRERMMALNLPGMAAELLPAVPAKQQQPAKHKGVSRKRLSEVLPRRESSRLRGIAADGSMIHAERQGEITVVAGEVIRRYASGAMTEEQEPQDRHPQGEVQFESSNASGESDEAFIQLLAHAAAAANSGRDAGSDAGSSPAGQQGGKAGSKRKGARGGAGKGSSGRGSAGTGAAAVAGGLGAADLVRLQLAEDDVAKVTKEATTHLAFHPTTDTLIVACADKKGNVSLWHVNEGSYELPPAARRAEPILRRGSAQQEQQQRGEGDSGDTEAEEEQGDKPATSAAAVSLDASAGKAARPGARPSSRSGASDQEQEAGPFDGVLLLQPQHYQYVSGLRWAGGSGRGAALFTASYDGSLRRLDVERGISDPVVSSEEDEYSCMDVTGDGRTALLGDNEGMLRVVDVRAPPAGGSLGPGLAVHAKKINTVHFEPVQEQVFATASTDTTIKLWDMRALSSSKGAAPKPLATGGHPQACQAALFAPDGSRRLVSTSFDNTCRVWDGAAGMQQLLAIQHDNQTGRWVLPFRACWNAAGNGVIVGNMSRFVDIYDASSGALAGQLSSPFMTAIPSRNAVHPHLPVLAAATNSGRIHIYR